jgi:membrane-bound serine protease (ClpP class)
VAALFLVVARKVLAARRERPVTGVEALVGAPGTVLAELAPEGRVRAAGLEWRARATPGVALPAGSQVVVTGVDGLTLEVEPAPPPAELGSPFPPVERGRAPRRRAGPR